MSYIKGKYTKRDVPGSGCFKVGNKVKMRVYQKNMGNDADRINGKVGVIIADQFVGVYDYLVQFPECPKLLANEEELVFAENALQRLRKRYAKSRNKN